MMKWSNAVITAIGSGATREHVTAAVAELKLPCLTSPEHEVKYTLQRLNERGRVRFDVVAKLWSKA